MSPGPLIASLDEKAEAGRHAHHPPSSDPAGGRRAIRLSNRLKLSRALLTGDLCHSLSPHALLRGVHAISDIWCPPHAALSLRRHDTFAGVPS